MPNLVENIIEQHLNQVFGKKYSSEFLALWGMQAWTYDNYLQCFKELVEVHEARAVKLKLFFVVFLLAAVVSWVGDFPILCGALIVLALRAYFISRQHMLVLEFLHVSSMLARLHKK